MTLLLIISIVLAIVSVPLTRLGVESEYDLDRAPWILKALLYSLSFPLWGYLLLPIWVAAHWAETLQNKTFPLDQNLKLKGLVIAFCWMVVVCQLSYQLGFRAGRKSTQKPRGPLMR